MARMWGIAAPICNAAILIFSLAACSEVDQSLFKPNRVSSQSEAGSIHLAVAPPIPFDAVSAAISPVFTLSGDDAVKAAIPDTTYEEDRFFQAFSAAIGLGPPRTGVSGPASNGQAPTAKAPDDKLADSGKSVLVTGDDKHLVKNDAMLQYAAGTALYQEVRLLERYVSYAAKRDRYKAFVLRMNIGVQPYTRNEPYDVYSSIGFFVKERACEVPAAIVAHPNRKQPYVLPLLVTDNLEGISSARSAEMITQMALAVSVLAQGFAGEASFGSTQDRLKSILGTDLNSLSTVARSADNVVQVRLGAASQPTSRFAMVPSNHTITILLLVPSEQFVVCAQDPYSPYVRVVMKSRLRDALKGDQLPFDQPALLQAIKPGLLDAGMDKEVVERLVTIRTDELHELLNKVQEQDRINFEKTIDDLEHKAGAKHQAYRDGVWLVLTEFMSRSPYQNSVVTLCDPDNKKSAIACPAVPPPPKPPATPDKKATGTTASGTTITTTITTTTNPPPTAKP
jgi:hypothetical protein